MHRESEQLPHFLADFPCVHSIAAHQLVDKLKTLEGFRLALVKTLGRRSPNYRVGIWIVWYFFCARSTTDNILSQGFPISPAEQPRFALDTKAGMLPVLQHVHTSLKHARVGETEQILRRIGS